MPASRRTPLTEDFRFHGPMLQSEGKAGFLEGSAGLCPIMRGADLHRQWEDGDDVCSIYDFKIETANGVVSISMAEWTTFRDGKLAAARWTARYANCGAGESASSPTRPRTVLPTSTSTSPTCVASTASPTASSN
ncbi:nuclear transport factor 2 family protein [Amycolatopsis lexingtonensis]|uniref:nuclear transport factor 2 family protein n=1 Tax=Amycolatopsis lexingtonensis TaxID=218822 RepID=UPI003F72CAC2